LVPSKVYVKVAVVAAVAHSNYSEPILLSALKVKVYVLGVTFSSVVSTLILTSSSGIALSRLIYLINDLPPLIHLASLNNSNY